MKLFPDIASFVEKNKKRNAEPKYSMHSLELVITVLLFFVIGRFIDSRTETTPLFTLLLGALGIVGSFASAYYRYIQASRALDENKAWDSTKERVPAPVMQDEKSELVIPQGYGHDDN